MSKQTLYRFFGEHNELLYIGVTKDAMIRWQQHSADKPWWDSVARVAVEHFPDRESVLAAEKRAIVTERPRHNVVHNDAVVLATAQRSLLTFLCDHCGNSINGDGYMIVYEEDIAKARKSQQWVGEEGVSAVGIDDLTLIAPWSIYHRTCHDEAASGHTIRIDGQAGAEELLRVTLGMIGKSWFALTDWAEFCEQVLMDSSTANRRWTA